MATVETTVVELCLRVVKTTTVIKLEREDSGVFALIGPSVAKARQREEIKLLKAGGE